MDNVIYIKEDNNNYYLIYKDLKTRCFIGKNGFTNNKKEGDSKTPVGLFKLGKSFGTHKNIDTKLEYIHITDKHYWIDDCNSKYYNQLINIDEIDNDWNSAEKLSDYPIEYEYAIEIKANELNVSGKGSAIFIHCINQNETHGCIAIPKEKMIELLKEINENTLIEIIDK